MLLPALSPAIKHVHMKVRSTHDGEDDGCVSVCVDKSHWDLVAKNSTYIDSLLTVLEVSCTVYTLHCSLLQSH